MRSPARCSLCGYVSDSNGKPPRVPTQGGWWAHAECIGDTPGIRQGEREQRPDDGQKNEEQR